MIEVPKINIGDCLTIQRKVSKEDTALNYGSGQLESLFATPRLTALMIEGSAQLIDKNLQEGLISVGKKIEVIHYKPTILGETISVKVSIEAYDGNKIILSMVAFDEIGVIGEGKHERIIVNKKALLSRANQRAEKIKNKNY